MVPAGRYRTGTTTSSQVRAGHLVAGTIGPGLLKEWYLDGAVNARRCAEVSTCPRRCSPSRAARWSVRGTAAEVTVRDSHVEGAVNVTGTGTQAYARNPVTIVGSEVGGWVDLERTQTWLSHSQVHRGFTARRAFDVRMCRATIAGDLTIQDTRLETDHRGIPDNGIVIGSPGVCGAPSADVPSVVVGGTVRLLRNTALGVEIQDAAVDGDLVCRENAGELGPGVTVRDVVVGGQRLGQCA